MPEHSQITARLQHPDDGLKLAERICRKHGLPSGCVRVGNATQDVFAAAGQYIVKLFAPCPADGFRNETAFLQALGGQLPIRTPELYAAEMLDHVPYIVMEHLPGAPLDAAWPTLSASEGRDIMRQVGAAARALHDMPLAAFGAASCDWHGFIDGQRAQLHEHQRAFGLDETWVAQLAAYMEPLALDLHEAAQMAPLHTELMPEHIFLTRTNAGWAVTGLIDFEPAMIGHREYEFAAVGLFLARGRRDLLRAFLGAYGYADTDLTPACSRRLMTLMLLHRYSNLNWFLSLLPADRPLTTLDQLEQFWYGL